MKCLWVTWNFLRDLAAEITSRLQGSMLSVSDKDVCVKVGHRKSLEILEPQILYNAKNTNYKSSRVWQRKTKFQSRQRYVSSYLFFDSL